MQDDTFVQLVRHAPETDSVDPVLAEDVVGGVRRGVLDAQELEPVDRTEELQQNIIQVARTKPRRLSRCPLRDQALDQQRHRRRQPDEDHGVCQW